MTVRLERIEVCTFADASSSATDPQLRDFLVELVASQELPLRADLLAAGVGHSYGEMAEPVLRAVATAADPIDLLVVAYAIPDVIPGRATATYLSSICPGNPLAFAICDQGRAAPFSALSFVHASLTAGDADRALVLVVEQNGLHYQPPVPVQVPVTNVAVGLVVSATHGRPAAAPTVWPDVRSGDVLALLQAEFDDRAAVLGAGLTEIVPPAARPERCVVVGPAQPLTGVWSALAGLPDTGDILVADYDAELGYLCLLGLTGGS